MNELFFSLIRIAIGTQESLPYAPSKEEWMELYAMAKKQSLVGIGFAGLQKLSLTPTPLTFVEPRLHSGIREQVLIPLVCTSLPTRRGEYLAEASEELEPCEVMAKYWNMPEMLYLKWMGMAAKIQQKNRIVNHHCVELQKKLTADGLRSCILKGQGVAALYRQHENEYENENIRSEASLSMFRQSGDIDVWMEGGFDKIMKWAKTKYEIKDFNQHHIDIAVFNDTEVEAHFVPANLPNPFTKRVLHKYFDSQFERQCICKQSLPSGEEITCASVDFNVVFILIHIFHHLFTEGVGLRQLMDYYFVLNEASLQLSPEGKRDSVKWIKKLGMERFASALMWVIGTVFGLSEEKMLWKPNQEDGEMILREVIISGNFGKQDSRMEGIYTNKLKSYFVINKKSFQFSRFDRWAWFWTPISRISGKIWKSSKRGIKY